MKFLSREFLLSAGAFTIGVLQQFGVAVPDELYQKVIGAVVAVAAVVAYILARTAQKKAGV